MERRARRGEGAGTVAGPAGRLQALEVADQASVGLGLDLAVGQEADGLLYTAGVAVAGCHQARGHAGTLLLLLLPASQIGHSHLQDVCFLLLGVRLLPEELWTQQGFQLLNAGVDAVSAQFLHHWLSKLMSRSQVFFRVACLSKHSGCHRCSQSHSCSV